MADKDTVTKEFMKDNKRFADAFNYFLFKGEQVIKPESLKEVDTTETVVEGTPKNSLIAQKVRDILKYTTVKEDNKVYYVMLGIENQTTVDNTMVVRNMVYDSMQYLSQLKTGSNPLKPIITLVIYYGIGKWSGPKSLHEMMGLDFEKGIGARYLKYIPDYKLNLIEPCNDTQENLKALTSDLKYVLSYLRVAYESEKNGISIDTLLAEDTTFNSVTKDSAYVIDVLTGSKYTLGVNEKGEVNMSTTWQNIGNDKYKKGKEEGIRQGIRQGKEEGVLETVKGLIKAKVSDDIILKASGITHEELKVIKEELKRADKSFTPTDLF